MAATTVQLNEFHSQCALPLEVRGPGSYDILSAVRAEGLLSSLYVKSVAAGATLSVTYYEASIDPGGGERLDLAQHLLIDDSLAFPLTDRLCVAKLHAAVRAEITVAGGTVEFGLYQSARSISVLDTILADGEPVPVTFTDPGVAHHAWATVATSAGAFVDVLTELIPGATSRNYKAAGVSCSTSGQWILTFDGVTVASGRTAPGGLDSFRVLDPKKTAPSGVEVKLRFRARVGAPTTDVDGHLMALDL